MADDDGNGQGPPDKLVISGCFSDVSCPVGSAIGIVSVLDLTGLLWPFL